MLKACPRIAWRSMRINSTAFKVSVQCNRIYTAYLYPVNEINGAMPFTINSILRKQ